MPTGDAVVDVLGHLGDDEARQIGIEAGDQAGRDDGAGHQLVGRDRCLQAVRIVDLLLGTGFQERELAGLIGRVCAGRRAVELSAHTLGRRRGERPQDRWSASAVRGADASVARGARSVARLQLQPEERRDFARLRRQAREATFSTRSSSSSGRLATPERRLAAGAIDSARPAFGGHAVVARRQSGQPIGDRLAIDVEQLRAGADLRQLGGWRATRTRPAISNSRPPTHRSGRGD